MGRKNPKRQKEKVPPFKKGNRKAKTCREKDKEKPLSNENGENTHPRAVKPETDQPSSALLLSNEEDGKVVCRTEPGLRNKGNTCFMNAAIQALLSCPPFAQYLTDSTVAKGNTSPSMFRCFKSLVEEMVSSRSHVVDPEDFFRTLCEMFPKFGDKQQQDCQNFTRLLLQLLKTELQYPAYDKSSHQLLYNSIIQDIFAGKLRTTVSCRCNKPRVYEDPIYELPLSVCKCQGETPNQKRSLEEAIHLFFMEIPLQRQSCGCSTETVKTDIIYLPEILVILLNWIHGRSCATGHFSFPLDNLSFQQYMPNLGPQDNITTYDLVAVVEHSGTPKSGHYKAYGKRHDEWYCFDDDSVEQVEQGRVETSHPYILFYRKVLPSQVKLCTFNCRKVLPSQVYISKEWLFKQKMFVDPGPIDNAAVLCEHRKLRNEVAGNPDNFLKELSYEEFDEYFKRYGGSLPLKVEYCNLCSKEMENKKSEISRFQELQVLFSRSPTNNQLALSRRWYDKWLKYVNGQAEYPGEIDNSRICDSDDKRCVAKYDPSGKMYMKVSVEMWKFLHDKYRGGPEVHVIQPSGEPQRGYREQRFPNYSLQAMSSSQPEDGNHSLELNKTEPALEADGRCHVSNQWYDNTDYTKNKEYPDDLSLPTNTQSDSMSYGRKALNYFKSKYGTFSAWTSQPEPGTRRELMMHTETHDDGTHVTSEDSLKEICVSIYEKFQQLGKEANVSDFVYCINKEWWRQFEAYTMGNDGTEKPGMIDNKFIAHQVHEATHIDGALRITGKQWILLSKSFGSEPQEPVIIRIRSQEGDMDVDSEVQPHPNDAVDS